MYYLTTSFEIKRYISLETRRPDKQKIPNYEKLKWNKNKLQEDQGTEKKTKEVTKKHNYRLILTNFVLCVSRIVAFIAKNISNKILLPCFVGRLIIVIILLYGLTRFFRCSKEH